MVNTITDSNAKIPKAINKTTYYKVVDKNNNILNANKTDIQDIIRKNIKWTSQIYNSGSMEGQVSQHHGERQFDGYKHQTADASDKSGYVSRPYTVEQIYGCGPLWY